MEVRSCFREASKALAAVWIHMPEAIGVVVLGGCRCGSSRVEVSGGKIYICHDILAGGWRKALPYVARSVAATLTKAEDMIEGLTRKTGDELLARVVLEFWLDSYLESRSLPPLLEGWRIALASRLLGYSSREVARVEPELLAERLVGVLRSGGARAFLLFLALKPLFNMSLGTRLGGRQPGRRGALLRRPLIKPRIGWWVSEVGSGRGYSEVKVLLGENPLLGRVAYIFSLQGIRPSYYRMSKRAASLGDDVLIPGSAWRRPLKMYVLVDGSGSMAGWKFERALVLGESLCQSGLNGCEILVFDEGPRQTLKPPLKGKLRSLQAYGGTRLSLALEAVMGKVKSGDGLAVISDWTMEPEDLRRSAKLLSILSSRGTSVQLIGVGRSPPSGPWPAYVTSQS